jgi:hypothetical protein
MHRDHCLIPSFCLVAATFWLAANLPAAEDTTEADRPKVNADEKTKINVVWRDDYAEATSIAKREGKMLLIFFSIAEGNQSTQSFESQVLGDESIRRRLQNYVCLRLPLDAKITIQGKPLVVIEHEAFGEMLGKPGIAIVDYRNDAKLRGEVVSTFPITEKLQYTAEQVAVILTLPPGTLTQRTLIYAVRTHPDKPASTDGEMNPLLLEEAENHSQYQANIRVQGHHAWDSRFRRILALLPGGVSPREVCAESWPGENLVEAAVECVRCWRLSSGHWSAVRASNRFFGYDMKRGGNGVWYATGIFGGR